MVNWRKLKADMHVSFNYNGNKYDGVVLSIGKDARGIGMEDAIWGYWNKNGNPMATNAPSHWTGGAHDWIITEPAKPKIQVGSTYLTPTGLKRVVVFADERGALADDPVEGHRKRYNHKLTGGWTLVPPEQWVNLYRRSDGVIVAANLKFKSEADALDQQKLDPLTKWIRTVRVDEAWNPASSG